MKIYKPALWITILFIALSFFPKSLIAWDREKFEELEKSHTERNNRLHLALGERVYDKTFNRVFDAIIIGLPDTGYTVKNMEKSSGYIFAEGKYEMPLDKFVDLINELNQSVKDATGAKPDNKPDYNRRPIDAVSIYILQLTNQQTKVKIRIKPPDPRTYPPYLEETYKGVWRAIERQVFLDENLDGDNKNESATNKISHQGVASELRKNSTKRDSKKP